VKPVKRGRLVVISAPSGTGKSTVCGILRARHEEISVSISYTTRVPRGKERDGIEYHFVNDETFDRMIAEGEFLEWAEVHGRRYGSARADTEALLDQGLDVLFDIDVQGGMQIKKASSEAVLIFLLPPSIEELTKRLRLRGTESQEQMKVRMKTAIGELEQCMFYDHHVINDVLDQAVDQVDSIRMKPDPKPKQNADLVQKLIRQAGNTYGRTG
jgi:guanylate kinase